MAAQNYKSPSDTDEMHLTIAHALNSVWNVITLLCLHAPNSLVLSFKGQKPGDTWQSLLIYAVNAESGCRFLAWAIHFSLCLGCCWATLHIQDLQCGGSSSSVNMEKNLFGWRLICFRISLIEKCCSSVSLALLRYWYWLIFCRQTELIYNYCRHNCWSTVSEWPWLLAGTFIKFQEIING